MKRLVLSTMFIVLVLQVFAQPSDASIKAKIKSKYSNYNNIILGKTYREKKVEGIEVIYYYYRHYTASYSVPHPKYKGLKGSAKGSVTYIREGSKYYYQSMRTTPLVIGMPNPDKTKVENFINANFGKYFYITDNFVGNTPKITIVPNAKYIWSTPDNLTFDTKVTTTEKVGDNAIRKTEYIYTTTITRENYQKNWSFIQPLEISSKEISRKTYSDEEMKSFRTMQETAIEDNAKAELASLPTVESPPVFKSEKQLFYYIHNKFMNSKPDVAKAHLYKVLSRKSFDKNYENVLLDREKEWVDKLTNNISAYKKTFCQYPLIKEEQYGMLYFYDKQKYRSVRYRGEEIDGTWRIRVIDYYPASKEELAELASMSGNCGSKPNLAVKEKVSYNIGDIVDVKYSNATLAAEIKKRDTNFDNRYYITFLESGKSQWMNDEQFSPSSQKKAVLKVGDHVNVKTGSGTYKGTIKEINGNKALIKWDEAGYKDLLTDLSNLSKI